MNKCISQRNRYLLSVMLTAFLTCHRLEAQSTFGTLTGTVTDPSGAVVAGATVVITNKRTQVARTVLTASDGLYLALNLDSGVYDLSVQSAGFQKLNRADVE